MTATGPLRKGRIRCANNHEEQVEVLAELLESGLPQNIVAPERAYAALIARVNDFRYWEAA